MARPAENMLVGPGRQLGCPFSDNQGMTVSRQATALAAKLARRAAPGTIASMALAHKKATTIALEPDTDRLLTRAARSAGVSRAEFIRRQLDIVLEQYRPHPKPRSAGIIKHPLRERGDEDELFAGRRR
jgi:hypothetical protein